MKLVLTPAPGAQVEVILKDGKKISNEDIKHVSFEPFFVTANGYGDAARGRSTTADNREVDRFLIVASGATGRVLCRAQSERGVVPSVDKGKYQKKSVTNAEAGVTP